MSADMEQIGALLGKALARQDQPPSVNVNVPEVKVSVDPAPLAVAIQAGHDMNAKALADVGGLFSDAMCKAVGAALRDIAPPDLEGVEVKIAALADAVSGADGKVIAMAVTALRDELARNNMVSAQMLAEMKEQTRIMLRPKEVTYDDQGRITSVRVV